MHPAASGADYCFLSRGTADRLKWSIQSAVLIASVRRGNSSWIAIGSSFRGEFEGFSPRVRLEACLESEKLQLFAFRLAFGRATVGAASF